MARSTPTYTPAGKYVLGGIISIALLIVDLNYQTFASVRALTQASGIYTQLILGNIVEYSTRFTAIYQDKRDLMIQNKKLKDELLLLQNKVFLVKQSELISNNVFSLEQSLKTQFHEEGGQSFKVASFDLKNYLCCSSHILYLRNPNKLNVDVNLPVSNGQTFVGQTSGGGLSLVKVILLSDASHILPIRVKNFYCNASGAGIPLMIRCLLPQNSELSSLKINDLAFTSGLGGVFPNDVQIGRITSIINKTIGEQEVMVRLDGDPLKQNYFGILVSP
jgi:rod shape-determining protein MreC